MEYTLKTKHLGLRNWKESDLAPYIEICQDMTVMRYFPAVATEEQCQEFIARMQEHHLQYGFCYFAVDELESGQFLGFIGLLHQTFESHFTPCVDIGWRLRQEVWGKGYATEGALACLEYAFQVSEIEQVVSVAVIGNKPSIRVMEKIGMRMVEYFDHPKLLDFPEMKKCVLYKIKNPRYTKM